MCNFIFGFGRRRCAVARQLLTRGARAVKLWAVIVGSGLAGCAGDCHGGPGSPAHTRGALAAADDGVAGRRPLRVR